MGGGFFDEVDETTTQAPVFTTPMKSIEIKEGQRAHFEARIIPVSDPTMRIEWLHNGQPIKQGNCYIVLDAMRIQVRPQKIHILFLSS